MVFRIRWCIFVMGVVFSVIIGLSCDKDLSTNDEKANIIKEPDIPFWRKEQNDGIVTLQIKKANPRLGEDGLPMNSPWVLVDSVLISETEHELTIDNAIPFQAEMGNAISFFFQGDFDGMEDAVFIWYKNLVTDKFGEYWENSTEYLKNNFGTAVFTKLGLTGPPIQGYIFCMDKDLENSGTGSVIIQQETKSDTICVDAAKNTVLFPPLLKTLEIEYPNGIAWSYLEFSIPDPFSFKFNKNHGSVIIETVFPSQPRKYAFSTCVGNGIEVTDTAMKLQIYGFVPKFKKEIQHE